MPGLSINAKHFVYKWTANTGLQMEASCDLEENIPEWSVLTAVNKCRSANSYLVKKASCSKVTWLSSMMFVAWDNDRDRRAWERRALFPNDVDLLLDTLSRGPVWFTELEWRLWASRRDARLCEFPSQDGLTWNNVGFPLVDEMGNNYTPMKRRDTI